MWQRQSHKLRPIFRGDINHPQDGIGFSTFVTFKMEETWNSIVGMVSHGILLVPCASLRRRKHRRTEASVAFNSIHLNSRKKILLGLGDGGVPKKGYPQSSIDRWRFHYKPSIYGVNDANLPKNGSTMAI